MSSSLPHRKKRKTRGDLFSKHPSFLLRLRFYSPRASILDKIHFRAESTRAPPTIQRKTEKHPPISFVRENIARCALKSSRNRKLDPFTSRRANFKAPAGGATMMEKKKQSAEKAKFARLHAQSETTRTRTSRFETRIA